MTQKLNLRYRLRLSISEVSLVSYLHWGKFQDAILSAKSQSISRGTCTAAVAIMCLNASQLSTCPTAPKLPQGSQFGSSACGDHGGYKIQQLGTFKGTIFWHTMPCFLQTFQRKLLHPFSGLKISSTNSKHLLVWIIFRHCKWRKYVLLKRQ